MTDYLYKFPDEAAAQTALAEYYDSETGWKTSGEGYALDAVGILTNEETVLDGWHVNLRVTDARPNPAKAYKITPSQQRRVWL
jgi:hypothetical protein